MEVSTTDLISALKTIRAACKTNRTYPILECVRMEANDGSLHIVAFNLDQQADLSVECVGDLSPLVVNSDDLAKWLAKASRASLATLTADERALSVRVGRSSAKLPLANLSDWPALSQKDYTTSCIVPGTAFLKALAAASVAVFKDVSRPHLCGVSIETGSVRDGRAKDRLALCGTNGVMLVAMDIPASGLTGPGRIIVPPECVDGLQKFFGNAETLTVSWGERLIEVKAGNKHFDSKLVAGTFPERWRGLGGAGRVPHLSFDKADLIAALSSVATFASEKGDSNALAVEMTIGDGATSMSAGPEHSIMNAKDECAHSILTEPPKRFITVGADQIIKISQALDADTIQLSIGAEHGVPVIVTGGALDDRIGMTVPLRDAYQQAKAA